MSVIQKAIQEVRHTIPEEILQQAFIDPGMRGRGLPVSLDHLIREKVIEGRVKPDIDLVGATEVFIPLTDLIPDRIDEYNIIYNIPKSHTHGKTITNALSITYGNAHRGSQAMHHSNQSSALMNQMDALMDSHQPIPAVSTARVRLIAENTILIEDAQMLPRYLYLRAHIENDDQLNNLRAPAVKPFCKLVTLATKAYIYVTLSVKIDEAFLRGGMTIGRVKEFVDDYGDANEQYEEYLNETWRKVAVFNDEVQRDRHLRSVIGGMSR